MNINNFWNWSKNYYWCKWKLEDKKATKGALVWSMLSKQNACVLYVHSALYNNKRTLEFITTELIPKSF